MWAASAVSSASKIDAQTSDKLKEVGMGLSNDLSSALPGIVSGCRNAQNKPVKGLKWLPPGACCALNDVCSDQNSCTYCQWGHSLAAGKCTWGDVAAGVPLARPGYGDVDKALFPQFLDPLPDSTVICNPVPRGESGCEAQAMWGGPACSPVPAPSG